MKNILLFLALSLSIGSLNADMAKVTYDDLSPLRPDGGKNEFWDTSNRALMYKYCSSSIDYGEDPISIIAWSASASAVTTVDHPETFMPRWYSEGESSMGSYEIRTPPLTILLY